MGNPAVVMSLSCWSENMALYIEHNDLIEPLAKGFGKYSAMFYALYDHANLSWRQMLLLGNYWVDFKITRQTQFDCS